MLGAGPRAAVQLAQEPAAPRFAAAGVHGNAGSARSAALYPGRWPDTAERRASAANVEPLVGKLHCNSVAADGKAGTTAHSLSKDSASVEIDAKALDRMSTEMDTEV